MLRYDVDVRFFVWNLSYIGGFGVRGSFLAAGMSENINFLKIVFVILLSTVINNMLMSIYPHISQPYDNKQFL